MPVERRGGADFDAGMASGKVADNFGKISLQVKPKGEEVRHDDDPRDAHFGQLIDRPGQIGRPATEECRLDDVKSTFLADGIGDTTHGFVSGLNGGAMSEDDDGGA